MNLWSLFASVFVAGALDLPESFISYGGELGITPPPELPSSLDDLTQIMDPGRLSNATQSELAKFKSSPDAIAIVFKHSPIGNVPERPVNSSLLSKWVLGTVTKFFGMLVGYEELESKALFKNIYTGDHDGDTSFIANYTSDPDRIFGWHIENFAHPHMPRYVLMQCLRQDTEKRSETLLLSGQVVASKLSEESLALLQQKRFYLTVEDTLNLDNISAIPEPIAILQQEQSGPAWRINLDSSFMKPATGDILAMAAFEELLEVAETSFETVKLETGDLIIWDNARLAHDRQFTGSSRWLQRTHAYTGVISPFAVFGNAEVGFLQNGDPQVIRTRGAFEQVFLDSASPSVPASVPASMMAAASVPASMMASAEL
jgi:hypothetical protein